MFKGQESLEFLLEQVSKDDPAASSHWQKYHTNFQVNNGNIEGIEGFGSNDSRYTGIRYILHLILQLRYKLWVLKSWQRLSVFLKLNSLNKKILKRQNKGYSLDCLRQTFSLTLLITCRQNIFSQRSTVWVIGDGFASMTNLIYESNSCENIVLVNLSKTLLVDLVHIKKNLSTKEFNNNVYLVTEKDSLSDISNLLISNNKKIILLEAKNHILLNHFTSNLVINIASMQEMNNEVIEEYFDHIHNNKNVYFYCCNREKKVLPDGTITEIKNYPWRENDMVILDELCPWHQKYYTFRFPFYKKYDGPIRHQLRKMNTN